MDNTKIIIEAIGYVGSALVLVSMLMTSVVKLRFINTIGSLIFTGYALCITSYPAAAMNFCLALINIYNLAKLFKNKKKYYVLKLDNDKYLINYFWKLYEKDIQKYFPEADKNAPCDAVYLVCYGSDNAGILLGIKNEDGSIDVKIDYTTPVYRDCSAGKYLYAYLASHHIPALFASTKSEIHRKYLLKMGFAEENGRLKKMLA
ncbi:YgjV family protein [bacterium]|nr:YgjV family protein [bacterium]MBR6245727.1 YgjV family protein [bacterium]